MCRQDLIRLERSWPTNNCWFRNFCFGIGTIVENAWRHQKNQLGTNAATHDVFIRKLAKQLGEKRTLKDADNETLSISAKGSKWRDDWLEKRKTKYRQLAGLEIGTVAAGVDDDDIDDGSHCEDQGEDSHNCKWCWWVHKKQRPTTNFCIDCNDAPVCRKASSKRDCFALHEQYGFPPVPLHSQLWQTYPEADKVHWDNIKQATAKRSRSVSPQGHAGACALNPKNQERKARAVLKIGGVARLEDRRG
jgi:hypothetical protein